MVEFTFSNGFGFSCGGGGGVASKGLRPLGSGGGGTVGGLGGTTKVCGLDSKSVGESNGFKSFNGGREGATCSGFGVSDGIVTGGEFSKGLGLALGAGCFEAGLNLLVFLAGGVGGVAFSIKGFSPAFLLDVSGDGALGLAAGFTAGAGVGAGGTGGGGGGS